MITHQLGRRFGATVIGVATIASAVLALPTTAAAASWVAPRVERVIGGPSRPGLGAWGLAYNPVTNELDVSDYTSNQLRRFDLQGVHLGDFSNPKGSTEGVSSAVAVDPRDGAVYLAVSGDGTTSEDVRKYSRSGTFLYDFSLPGSVTWLTVDEQGDLWVPEAFGGTRVREWRVSDATQSATALTSFGTSGSGPGQLKRLTGIEVEGGRVYVVDAGNTNVHVFTTGGTWLFDIDGGIFPGDMRGVVADGSTQRLFVANSQAGTIETFDLDGNHLDTFGGLGDGPGQFLDGARALTITPDGHVWAADYGGRRLQEFLPDGTFLAVYPDPPMLPDDAGQTSPRGVAVDPGTGDVLVADTWGQRIQRFAPDGTLLDVHGHRGSFVPDGMNYPRSVAVDPATRNIWVGNYEGNPDLVVFTPTFGFVRRISTPRFVNDLEVVGDETYAVIRRPGSINVYSRTTGALLRTCCTGLGLLRGIEVDRATGNLWVTSDQAAELYVLSPSGSRLRTIALDGRGWGVTIVGDVVYVADAKSNEVIAFDRTTYARLGSFGSAGFLPGQLRGPSGLDSDAAGRLYVIEERGARVQVFGWSAKPPLESAPPVVSYGTVAQAGPAPLVIGGTAADASGALQVELTIQDLTTGKYWSARAATWGTSIWNPAIVFGPVTSPGWRFTLVTSLDGHSYRVRVRGIDVHGNISTPITRTFLVG